MDPAVSVENYADRVVSTQNLLDLLFFLNRADHFVENVWDAHATEVDTIIKAIARRVAERTVTDETAPRPNLNTYWVVPYKFLAGEYPGDKDPVIARVSEPEDIS